MKAYLEEVEQVINQYQSSEKGLSVNEAAARLEKDGKNKLIEAKKTSLARRFINQFINPMIIVLLAAAIISAITAFYTDESLADVFIILFVVLLNAILGVIQENKAEKAIESLKKMTAATSKVLRNGEIIELASEDLVCGDVIILEAGDHVPADARIIESASLQAEESALTGESVPVSKDVAALAQNPDQDIPLGDRINMLYMGSAVVYGRGKAIVTDSGMNTQMGKIASSIEEAKEGETPLQIKLKQLGKTLTIMVLVICVFIFAFSLLRADAIDNTVLTDTFLLAVSLAVAAIPEGLVAVVTIVLSIGVTKMSKNNAVIRKLTAVETLGCTQVICSDKTGTLTQNKMTVVNYCGDDQQLLATAMALCNDAELKENGETIGEPTEAALINYAKKLDLDKNKLVRLYPRVGEIPFESSRKMMSTVHCEENQFIQYTKGAPDELLKCCQYIMRGGETIPLTEQIRNEILTENKKFADQALRVLGAAMRKWPDKAEIIEDELVFLGLMGMIDPVRPEVKSAIENCKTAGIKPIMITGDHRDTAIAIAMELGIIHAADQAITGAELDKISDQQLIDNINHYSVFARVQPEHKVRIVKAWKANNTITAMTGDGVNDAPAIKNADIGIGMGITGTDVTKNVADMVLADDNFATIVAAVEEGRKIYDNIRKTIQFLLASNLSEVLAIFVATIFGFTILYPVHILWINLITDSVPALALGMEKGEPDIMSKAPRDPDEGVFARGVGTGVIYQGVVVALLTLAAYFIGFVIEGGSLSTLATSEDGITMAFLTLSMAEIFHSFNLRSLHGSLFKIKKQNKYLYGSLVISMILTAAIVFIPAFSDLFGFAHISLNEYLIAMILAFSVIPIVELVKLGQRAYLKRKRQEI